MAEELSGEKLSKVQEALTLFAEIESQYRIAGTVPPLPESSQVAIKGRLGIMEARLNFLFPKAIPPARKNMAGSILFLDTEEFFTRAILRGRKLPTRGEDFPEVVRFVIETFETQGLRTPDGKQILVQTTVTDPGLNPRQIRENEAEDVAAHEMVHGKVEPKITRIDDRTVERRTGCKVITILDGINARAENVALYEAQTDLVMAIGRRVDARSWLDVMDYLSGITLANDQKQYQATKALALLTAAAFSDFQAGVEFLGNAYFRCENIVLPLWTRLDEKHPESAMGMQQFALANHAENPGGMLDAARIVSEITKQK